MIHITQLSNAVHLLYLLGFTLIVWDTFHELRSYSVSSILMFINCYSCFVFKQLGSGLSP